MRPLAFEKLVVNNVEEMAACQATQKLVPIPTLRDDMTGAVQLYNNNNNIIIHMLYLKASKSAAISSNPLTAYTGLVICIFFPSTAD